jgi:hypothetical protein
MGRVPRVFELRLADVNQPIEAQKRGQGLSPTQCSRCHLDAKLKIDTNKQFLLYQNDNVKALRNRYLHGDRRGNVGV